MILLKDTKKHGFILSPEDTFFEKPMGEVKLILSASLGLTFQDLETSSKVLKICECFKWDMAIISGLFP